MRRNSVGVSSALSPSTYAWTLSGSSAKLLDDDSVAAARLGVPWPPSSSDVHASGQLLHRERLDEVVVGADLECVHAVVLGSAGRHDDDRRPDPFRARLLDHAPAVDPGEHQVEDADVGALVAETREARLAVGDADRVEAGRLEVARHPAGDDVVVLDDQNLRHSRNDCGPRRSSGAAILVTDWYPDGEGAWRSRRRALVASLLLELSGGWRRDPGPDARRREPRGRRRARRRRPRAPRQQSRAPGDRRHQGG